MGARSLGMPKRMLLLFVKGSGFGWLWVGGGGAAGVECWLLVVVVVSEVTWFRLEAELL